MMKRCGLAVPTNPSGNRPPLPTIVWHDPSKAFVGESMLAAQAAAKETFGTEPDLIFVALPSKDKGLYQEVWPIRLHCSAPNGTQLTPRSSSISHNRSEKSTIIRVLMLLKQGLAGEHKASFAYRPLVSPQFCWTALNYQEEDPRLWKQANLQGPAHEHLLWYPDNRLC